MQIQHRHRHAVFDLQYTLVYVAAWQGIRDKTFRLLIGV